MSARNIKVEPFVFEKMPDYDFAGDVVESFMMAGMRCNDELFKFSVGSFSSQAEAMAHITKSVAIFSDYVPLEKKMREDYDDAVWVKTKEDEEIKDGKHVLAFVEETWGGAVRDKIVLEMNRIENTVLSVAGSDQQLQWWINYFAIHHPNLTATIMNEWFGAGVVAVYDHSFLDMALANGKVVFGIAYNQNFIVDGANVAFGIKDAHYDYLDVSVVGGKRRFDIPSVTKWLNSTKSYRDEGGVLDFFLGSELLCPKIGYLDKTAKIKQPGKWRYGCEYGIGLNLLRFAKVSLGHKVEVHKMRVNTRGVYLSDTNYLSREGKPIKVGPFASVAYYDLVGLNGTCSLSVRFKNQIVTAIVPGTFPRFSWWGQGVVDPPVSYDWRNIPTAGEILKHFAPLFLLNASDKCPVGILSSHARDRFTIFPINTNFKFEYDADSHILVADDTRSIGISSCGISMPLFLHDDPVSARPLMKIDDFFFERSNEFLGWKMKDLELVREDYDVTDSGYVNLFDLFNF